MMLKIKIAFSVLCMLLLIYTAQSQVKEYFIAVDPADWQRIYEDPYTDTYVPVTISYEGITWEDVQMRIRGDGTRRFPKKSLKFKFESEPFYNGKDVLNLNAEYVDKTYANALMSSMLYRSTGHPCFEAENIRVYINGKYSGLYLSIENIDESFLERWDLDTEANLYKATRDGSCLSLEDDVYYHWEKKTNAGEPRDDLAKLIDSLNTVPDDDYYNFCKRTFFYDEMINLISINLLIANGSTYSHNYYMYHDKNNTGKWLVIPWDMDKTWNYYFYNFPPYFSTPSWLNDNPMIERAFLTPEIFNDIIDRLVELNENYFNQNIYNPIIDSLEQTLLESVITDETDDIETEQEYLDEVDRNRHHVKNRFNTLMDRMLNNVRSFKVFPTSGTYTDDVILRWNKPEHPQNLPITYRLLVGEKSTLYENESMLIENITDTSYTLSGLAEGNYYWMVVALDGRDKVEGTNNHNSFTIKYGSEMPCEITSNTTLKKDNSPYVISCNVTIPDGVTLKVDPGVELHFKENGHITCDGNLIIEGSSSEPIVIKPVHDAYEYNVITTKRGTDIFKLGYVEITNTQIDINSKDVHIYNVDFYQTKKNDGILNLFHYGDIIFEDSYIHGNNTGEGTLFIDCIYVVVRNTTFENTPDAVEIILTDGGEVRNNYFYSCLDDAIDFNASHNVEVTGNVMYKILDKAISVGNDEMGISDNIYISNNLMVDVGYAVAVKSGSTAHFINNTVHNSGFAMSSYQKFDGYGPATLYVENSIFTGTRLGLLKIEDESSIIVSYSLCETEELPGEGNIFADPLYNSIKQFDFTLQAESPCIDAGNPDSRLDPDGTRVDIGAYSVNQGKEQVVINEINYNSSNDFDPEDWVEFYNPTDNSINMSNWYFSDDDNTHKFIFPDNTSLAPDSYLILCKDRAAFIKLYPEVSNSIGDMGFGLGGSGDQLRLFNEVGELIDFVEYDDIEPWPLDADGIGATLELINPQLDNELPENWRASSGYGTPGKKNSVYSPIGSSGAGVDICFECYPNPASEHLVIRFYLDTSQKVTVSFIDESGREALPSIIRYMNEGEQTRTINLSELASGTYFIRLSTELTEILKKFVVVR